MMIIDQSVVDCCLSVYLKASSFGHLGFLADFLETQRVGIICYQHVYSHITHLACQGAGI